MQFTQYREYPYGYLHKSPLGLWVESTSQPQPRREILSIQVQGARMIYARSAYSWHPSKVFTNLTLLLISVKFWVSREVLICGIIRFRPLEVSLVWRPCFLDQNAGFYIRPKNIAISKIILFLSTSFYYKQ